MASSNYFEFTLQDYINFLGEPNKKEGSNYVWKCPYCVDTAGDNLKYNANVGKYGVLKCFAKDGHETLIQQEMRKRILENKTLTRPTFNTQPRAINIEPPKIEPFENGETLAVEYNNNFKKDIAGQKEIELKRGLKADTCNDYKIGRMNQYGNEIWVIPKYQYLTHNIIGFETRPFVLPNAVLSLRTKEELENKQKLRTFKGTRTDLCEINKYTDETAGLMLVEGFFDGLALYQRLKENGNLKYYHIVTVGSGINGLKKQVEKINFAKYNQDKIYLFVDDDEAGQEDVLEVTNQYKQIQTKVIKGYKDYNEYYIKCVFKEKETTEEPIAESNSAVDVKDDLKPEKEEIKYYTIADKGFSWAVEEYIYNYFQEKKAELMKDKTLVDLLEKNKKYASPEVVYYWLFEFMFCLRTSPRKITYEIDKNCIGVNGNWFCYPLSEAENG